MTVMAITLLGELVRKDGMYYERIFQHGKKFILESQSEMMEEPCREEFNSFDEAYTEMLRRT